ncbi:MAG TPA: iron-containing alcohol dehydrogenase [Steroidobacteraceae bacterium]|nr:iron-containing alcohol dehydrogenase [Steroidobacteraceae bacterium]
MPDPTGASIDAGVAYLPIAALVDYELTLTKPKRLTADTAIDALTHAIEAKRANGFSDQMALAAMRAIAPNCAAWQAKARGINAPLRVYWRSSRRSKATCKCPRPRPTASSSSAGTACSTPWPRRRWRRALGVTL